MIRRLIGTERGERAERAETRDSHGRVGLAQNALYVLRPDAYVGLANESAAAEVLRGYFATLEILV